MIAFNYDLFQTASGLMESRYASVLLEAMAQNGLAVEVLGAYTDSPWLSPRWLQPMPRFTGGRWLFEQLNHNAARRELSGKKPTVLLQALGARPLSASAVSATVALVHHFAPFRFPSPQNEKIQKRWTANLLSANGLIFSSRFAQQECYDLFPAARAKPYTVILPASDAKSRSFSEGSQSNVLLYCGPREGHHNFSLLLQALHAAHGLEVLCFGGKPFNASEKREMILLKRKDIVFKYIESGSKTYFNALEKSSILVNCSTYGALSTEFIDACVTGCGLWLSDTPAHSELGEMSQALFNPFNPEELSALLIALPAQSACGRTPQRSLLRASAMMAHETADFLGTFS